MENENKPGRPETIESILEEIQGISRRLSGLVRDCAALEKKIRTLAGEKEVKPVAPQGDGEVVEEVVEGAVQEIRTDVTETVPETAVPGTKEIPKSAEAPLYNSKDKIPIGQAFYLIPIADKRGESFGLPIRYPIIFRHENGSFFTDDDKKILERAYPDLLEQPEFKSPTNTRSPYSDDMYRFFEIVEPATIPEEEFEKMAANFKHYEMSTSLSDLKSIHPGKIKKRKTPLPADESEPPNLSVEELKKTNREKWLLSPNEIFYLIPYPEDDPKYYYIILRELEDYPPKKGSLHRSEFSGWHELLLFFTLKELKELDDKLEKKRETVGEENFGKYYSNYAPFSLDNYRTVKPARIPRDRVKIDSRDPKKIKFLVYNDIIWFAAKYGLRGKLELRDEEGMEQLVKEHYSL